MGEKCPKTGKQHGELREHAGTLYAINFSSDSKQLASGGKDGRLVLWNVERATFATALDFRTFGTDIQDISYFPNGPFVAIAGAGSKLFLCDPRTKEILCELVGSPIWFSNTATAFSPGGKVVAFACGDLVTLYNTDKLMKRKGPR
jgi:WD40 repeat protein